MANPLGRLTPENFDHVTAKPLSEVTLVTARPVCIGINWYTAFDSPVQLADGSWHLPDSAKANLGTVRGGHCVCLVPSAGGVASVVAHPFWQTFYNQGQEGACEGFAHAKAQTLEKGVTFDPWFLYDEARKLEGSFPDGEGTTNRSVCTVLERQGAPEQVGPTVATRGAKDSTIAKIATVRWTQKVDEVLSALGRPNAFAVPVSNSWGIDYPAIVWLPVTTLARLLAEEGEADCCTDV
jgi:hypothetical protein